MWIWAGKVNVSATPRLSFSPLGVRSVRESITIQYVLNINSEKGRTLITLAQSPPTQKGLCILASTLKCFSVEDIFTKRMKARETWDGKESNGANDTLELDAL